MPFTEQPTSLASRYSDRVIKSRPLVAIVGPTAVGKTEIALQIAERMQGEIVSADSRLLYRGMDIGTAKPSPTELSRVPHSLVDVAEPDQVWSLASFKAAATQAIQEIHSRGRLPFLVGGTGQYIRAILEQWDIPSAQPNLQLRKVLEQMADQETGQRLHQHLATLDPAAAITIDPRNVRRTVRAMEVILTSGRRFSSLRGKTSSPYQVLVIGLKRSRTELYARIDARVDKMIERGLVSEVQKLLAKGFSPDLPTLSAIGYREINAYLNGEISLEDAVVQMKRKTRIFVRRQANWFKETDPNIRWFEVHPAVVDEIEREIWEWLEILF